MDDLKKEAAALSQPDDVMSGSPSLFGINFKVEPAFVPVGGPDRTPEQNDELFTSDTMLVDNKSVNEALDGARRKKRDESGVSVKPRGLFSSSEDRMENSIYSRIVSAMRRIADAKSEGENEAQAATETPAPAPSPVSETRSEVEESAVEMGPVRKKFEEQLKKQIKDEVDAAQKQIEQLKSQQVRSTGPEVPPETLMLSVLPGTEAEARAKKIMDDQTKAILGFLSAILKQTERLGDLFIKQADKVYMMADAVSMVKETEIHRKLLIIEAGLKEKLKAAFDSKDAIQKMADDSIVRFKELPIGVKPGEPSQPALVGRDVREKTKSAPGEVLWESIPEIINAEMAINTLTQKIESGELSQDDLEIIKSTRKELEDAAGKIKVAPEFYGTEGAREFFKEQMKADVERRKKWLEEGRKEEEFKPIFARVLNLLGSCSDRLIDYYKKQLEGARPLGARPLTSPHAKRFNEIINDVRSALDDLDAEMSDVLTIEKKIGMSKDMEQMVDMLSKTKQRLSSIQILSMSGEELPGRPSGYSHNFERMALVSSPKAAEAMLSLKKINSQLDEAFNLLFPQSEVLIIAQEISDFVSGGAEFLDGIASDMREALSDESISPALSGSYQPAQMATASSRDVIYQRLIRISEKEKGLIEELVDNLFNLSESNRELLMKKVPEDVRKKVELLLAKKEEGVGRGLEKKMEDLTNPENLKKLLRVFVADYYGLSKKKGVKNIMELSYVLKELKKGLAEISSRLDNELKIPEAKAALESGDKELQDLIWQLQDVGEASRQLAMDLTKVDENSANKAENVLYMLGDVYANLVDLTDKDAFAITEAVGKNMALDRNWKSFFRMAKDNAGKLIPSGLGQEVASDIIQSDTEAFDVLKELLKAVTAVKVRIEGHRGFQIRTPPTKSKGSPVDVSVQEKAKEAVEEMKKSVRPSTEEPSAESDETEVKSSLNKYAESENSEMSGSLSGEISSLKNAADILRQGSALVDVFSGWIKDVAGLSNFIPTMEIVLNSIENAKAAGSEKAAPAMEMGELALASASQDGDAMNRTAGEFDKFDASSNRLEIVEGENGKRKLVVNKGLKNLVSKKIQEMLYGGFKCGDSVQVDLVDHLGFGTVKAYLGSGVYRVEVDGAVMEVPAKHVLGLDGNPWR